MPSLKMPDGSKPVPKVRWGLGGLVGSIGGALGAVAGATGKLSADGDLTKTPGGFSLPGLGFKGMLHDLPFHS